MAAGLAAIGAVSMMSTTLAQPQQPKPEFPPFEKVSEGYRKVV